jgi:hypothetical protein
VKKSFTIVILFFTVLMLIGCNKNKQDIVDKCLLQANQTFPNDLSQKSMFFQGCMVEYKYAFNAHNCDKDKQVDILSGICYVKY